MVRSWIAIACFVVALVSCDKQEDKLEGKWQLKTVEANGEIQEVDTVWYNFQTSLFEYQFYDPTLVNDSLMGKTAYPFNYGYNTWVGENELELELVDYGRIALSRFLLYTDWDSSKRTFTIEKLSTNDLVLNGDGKTYTFRKF